MMRQPETSGRRGNGPCVGVVRWIWSESSMVRWIPSPYLRKEKSKHGSSPYTVLGCTVLTLYLLCLTMILEGGVLPPFPTAF